MSLIYFFFKAKLQENNTEMVLGKASTTISAASKCSDIEENINYKGNNINREIKLSSLEDCRTICQRVPNCVGWSYQTSKMSLVFKKRNGQYFEGKVLILWR